MKIRNIDDSLDFAKSVALNIEGLDNDEKLKKTSFNWLYDTTRHQYTYNFKWLGRPIIQLPQDIMAMQEIIWEVQPDLIIETGVARGGSLVFYASILELNAICGGIADAEVLGVDIEIRAHNRLAIENHPLAKRILMIEGDSISTSVLDQVKAIAANKEKILVCLDSNHTHDHVFAELEAYAPLVTQGSYCVVFDTVIEDMSNFSESQYSNRPWGKGNNPKTAVYQYLKEHPEFKIDKSIDSKLMITVAPDGYLKRK